MGRFEVQGIVSMRTGEPIVQFGVEVEGHEPIEFQVPAVDARDMAQNIQEASTNAVYEAALLAWAKDKDPENGEVMGAHLIEAIRRFRADKWGLPDKPEDWAPEPPGE